MSNLTIDVKPSGSSSFGKIKDWLTAQVASEVKLDVFNRNLDVFVKDWKVATASIYGKRSYKDYDAAVKVKHMVTNTKKILGVDVPTHRTLATIELKVSSNKLGSFINTTKNESVTEAGGSGTFRVTRASILRKQHVVAVIGKKSKSSFFAGARDQKTPVHKGKIKGFSPKGYKNKIFIRLQANTWRQGRRLPIAEMYGIPNAYLLNSKRTKEAFRFEQRIKDLWKP